jgi:transcriptional regulator with XRE-family HTH domain
MLNPVRVKEALEERGIKRKFVADNCEVHESRVSEWLRDKDPVPIPKKHEAKIKEITGKTLKWLRSEDDS